MSPRPVKPAVAPKGRSRIRFPPELPISAKVQDIIDALSRHQVVIVAGATGSGKTTQLPKIALEMGRGAQRQIGVTQPRRIAATSVAARVASELGCELGNEVGYQIRFEDRTCANTWVKFMTDGILLAEIQGDRLLGGYDTLIIDEAHERSLTIDFLLGWLKCILPKRQDLKVVISSATIETERFSEFFDGAPVIQVEGRTYPVEVLYEPPEAELDLADAVADAVENVTGLDPHGDILVFLPGEREIHDTEHALTGRNLRHTQVMPLYARLSAADQSKVFASISKRRVILATNVAETSLTLPGIVYVIDTGVARLSRYDPKTGTTRLQIEGISQASADQRKGRCGRVREGICIRLFDEESFAARPGFTDPEIKRTDLAGVILRMKSLELGNVEDFPFLDPPRSQSITEGYRVLQELGALDDERNLTELGKRLGHFPVDPRVGRMILAGAQFGCLREILVLAAALNLQDPRERPRGLEAKADQLHHRFADECSDFSSLLRLWTFVQQAENQGTSHLRKTCKESFLSFPRIREWLELYRQLENLVREHRVGTLTPHDKTTAPPVRENGNALHLALLTGLLSRIGQWNAEHRAYLGARQTRFTLHPSSGLAKKPPAWVMVFELVQTSQLFARMAAKIDPLWLDQVGSHLMKRSYSDPHWSEKSARASVREHATLFGLPVLKDRSVDYATIAPELARLMFLEHALVRGEYHSRGDFQEKNRQLFDTLAKLRDKARQSDLLTDDERLLSFFDKRVSSSVVNGKTFETWRQQAEKDTPNLLYLSYDDVLTQEDQLDPAHFPDHLLVHGVELALCYAFDPSAEDDGITVYVPLAVLPQLSPPDMEYTIPAWHVHKITALLEELPRTIRRELGNLSTLASAISTRVVPGTGPFLGALSQSIFEVSGVEVPVETLTPETIPPYLRYNYRIVGERGNVVSESRDLAQLQRQYGVQARELFARSPISCEWERKGLTRWDFDELPTHVTRTVQGLTLRSFPALLDRKTSVELALLESPTAAQSEHLGGVRRLITLATQGILSTLAKRAPAPISRRFGLPVSRAEIDSFRELLLARVLTDAFELYDCASLPRSKADFDQLLARGTPRLTTVFDVTVRTLATTTAEHEKTLRALDQAAKHPSGSAVTADVRAQLEHLFPKDFLAQIDLIQLQHFPRYLRAAQARLARAVVDPRKDATKAAPFSPLWKTFLTKQAVARDRQAVHRLRFTLEELRVALFAPELKPAEPVSLENANRAIAELR